MKRAEVRYIPPKWCASGVVPHVYSKSVGASKPNQCEKEARKNKKVEGKGENSKYT